jgi:hypothetical protein
VEGSSLVWYAMLTRLARNRLGVQVPESGRNADLGDGKNMEKRHVT